MGFIFALLSGIFRIVGMVNTAEQICLNWQKSNALKKAQAIAAAKSPTDVKGVEDALDKGEA